MMVIVLLSNTIIIYLLLERAVVRYQVVVRSVVESNNKKTRYNFQET
jgi:hypothetical protein